MDRDELVFVVGIFIKNPLIAFIVEAIVIGIEIMLLEVIAKGLDKFPGMKSCGDHIRIAMSRILEIALLVGGMVAANDIAPGIGFFCINVQEIDLAGHAENVEGYAEKLKISDENLEKIINLLNDDDILLVTADHGNDPTIGHGKYTRENVPILLYRKKIKGKCIGHRNTLSDIGATVAEYFVVEMPENGESFLELIKQGIERIN